LLFGIEFLHVSFCVFSDTIEEPVAKKKKKKLKENLDVSLEVESRKGAEDGA